ncbi:MAG: hypothetical protein MPJ50_09295 [Pirellulales bacterium]|nr:hypothetical protein [Pirellulales bacterium]
MSLLTKAFRCGPRARRTTQLALLASIVAGFTTASSNVADAEIIHKLGANGTLSVFGTRGEDEIVAYYDQRSLGKIHRASCLVVEVRERIGGRLEGEAVYLAKSVKALHIDGMPEDDLIDCSAMKIPCTIYGGHGNDDILGGWRDDDIDGGTGADEIEGGPGDDILFGGLESTHWLYGDTLLGGSGQDVLIGSQYGSHTSNYDVLKGGPDEDTYLYCAADWLEDDDADPIYGYGGLLFSDYWSSNNPYGVEMTVIEQDY